ncbi:MAG: glycosyl hydrolase family 18 protein [bacterium]
MKKILYSITILISTVLFSQPEPKGIHQIEWEYYNQFKSEQVAKSPVVEIVPMNQSAASSRYLNKAVFGYLPYWERSSAPQYFQYNLLSHIAVFDWGTSPTGILSNPSGWPGDWSAMINNAHKYGVKVVMCVVEFDDEEMHTLINDASNKLNFINNVISEIRSYNLDGVNIDFEAPKTEDRGTIMNRFMSQLTDSVHSQLGEEYEVSFAGPAINWSDRWDLAGLANACDYIFIMGYSFWGSWSSTAGPTAPLEGLTNSITSSVMDHYGDVVQTHPEKLILGTPYYGNRWQTLSSTEGSSSEYYIGSVFYSSAADIFRNEGRNWSSSYKVPWTSYYTDQKWYQVWCDDDESLNLKYNLLMNNKLLGSGMWALGYDDDEMALWNLLARKYYQFPDEYTIADFGDTLGVFYTDLTYSGSTTGISTESILEVDNIDYYSGTGSMKLLLKDNASSTNDWTVRILANRGDKFLNRGFSRNGLIRLRLKTTDGNGKAVAVTVDDMVGGTEISDKIDIIGDGNWHEYVWDFQNDPWNNFSVGNGKIDGPIVSLDAILLFSPNQNEDWALNIDDIEYEIITNGIVTSIPDKISLKQNYPNPFNGHTTIEYSLLEEGDVSLKVYNIAGQLVEELVHRRHQPGSYRFQFSSEKYSSGVYIYKLISNSVVKTEKMTLLK